VWLALIVGITVHLNRMPSRIVVRRDGRILFQSWLRQFEVRASEIESIKPGTNNLGFLVVRTKQGKVILLNQFDGFHKFLHWLTQENPSVELRGC
jgi:hypothetical protein